MSASHICFLYPNNTHLDIHIHTVTYLRTYIYILCMYYLSYVVIILSYFSLLFVMFVVHVVVVAGFFFFLFVLSVRPPVKIENENKVKKKKRKQSNNKSFKFYMFATWEHWFVVFFFVVFLCSKGGILLPLNFLHDLCHTLTICKESVKCKCGWGEHTYIYTVRNAYQSSDFLTIFFLCFYTLKVVFYFNQFLTWSVPYVDNM